MQDILCESIRTDGGVQSRAAINREYVTELADQIKGGKKFPAVDVYRDGDETWMADGFHRLLGHQEAGKRTIRANVHKGGQSEAAWASCAANQEHGLRRSPEDKRKAINMALDTHAEMSDRAIADHVGVGERTVWTVRQSRKASGSANAEPVVRVGKDGKTYRIPPPPPNPQRVTPPPPSEKPRFPPPPPSVPAAKPAARLDALGKAIPDHLLPLFDRAPEVQALMGQLSSVRGVLKRAEETGDALYADVNFNAALAALQTAYDAVKATKPYAVCPWCHGTLSDQCRGCGHRGVLGEHRWNTTVPRELKK